MLYINGVPCDIQPRVRRLAGIDSYSTPFHTILCRVVYDAIGVNSSNCYQWRMMAGECEDCLLLADIFIGEGEEQ